MVFNPRLLRIALACAAAVGIAIAGLLWLREKEPAAPAFVGTQACAACHQQAFSNWQQSHHRHAMEIADAKSVLGDFKDAKFDYFGITSRFFTRDGQYFVETDNARGELETFRIAYTFGYFPLQQYLIKFPDGRLQVLGISWDSRPATEGGQRWYHLHPDEKITFDNPLHWTGAFQNWNTRCAACHSTDIVRNYSQETNRYDTTWQDLNVGCEACHGPGSQHLAWAKDKRPLPNKGLTTDVARIWTPTNGQLPIPAHVNATMSGQLQACAGCHSRRAELQHPDPAANYFDNYSLTPLLDGLYYPDGQIREEVYEIGSFLQSRMHQNHVSCTNCHEPHSSQLRVRGNGLCLQCHATPQLELSKHDFHDPESPGMQCVSCHMPQHTYMGVDVRHDHSFRVPDPSASHYPHTQLLTRARSNMVTIAPDLLAYARDNSRPAILRSIVLQESGRFPSMQQQATITAAMQSPDPLLRMGAAAALGSRDVSQRLALLRPLLQDSVKSVRNIVARELIDLPLARAPPDVRPMLGKLFDEYQQTLLHNADMPESMSDLGLFYAAQGNMDAAEKALQQSRKLAPRYLPAMLNLADLYRARNRDDLGETLLRDALAYYPESGDAPHLLGLLYVRTGRMPQSVPLLRKATELAPDNAQYALVYALSLIETGKQAQGIAALEQAARRFPDNEPIHQALDGYRPTSAPNTGDPQKEK